MAGKVESTGLYDGFDPARAFHARDLAIADAAERDEGYWADLARRAVAGTARSRDEFTTDDVLKQCPQLEAVPELRVLGAAMLAAGPDGVCVATVR